METLYQEMGVQTFAMLRQAINAQVQELDLVFQSAEMEISMGLKHAMTGTLTMEMDAVQSVLLKLAGNVQGSLQSALQFVEMD